MFRFAVVLALFAAAAALNLEAEWSTFKSKFGKQYANVKEEMFRRQVWEKHMHIIEKHNLEWSQNKHSYYLGQNEFADMPNDEFVRMMNNYDSSKKQASHLQYSAVGNVRDLPDTVDWRTKGYVTEVKNQAQCGSCWAFSTTGSLEGQHFKKYNKLVSLSEQNLVDCSRKQGNQGCEGGLMDQAFKYIKENNGIDTEASYPYEGKNGQCRFQASNVGANLTGFVDVKSKDEGALQDAVANIGPISVAIDANHMTFQLYAGGVYHNFLCSQTRLDHGVLAAGYGKYEGKDYWLVKNSWGKTWGKDGYIMMSRNRDNNCGIATQASYPTV